MATSIEKERMRAWKAFLAAQRAVLDRLETEMQDKHGLTLSGYEVLMRLNDAEGRHLCMNELADSVLLTPSGITRLIDRLEADGLVRRERSARDRRRFELVLTTAGRARLRRAALTHLRGVRHHFADHLSDREAEVVGRTFSTMLAALSDERDQPPRRDGVSAERS